MTQLSISILLTISKIFEKHVNKHLINYLNKYKLFHEKQSGFLQTHSCKTALVKLIDQWMQCIDNGDFVGCLFIEFKKAFDKVEEKLQCGADNTKDWSRQNNMHINYNKRII